MNDAEIKVAYDQYEIHCKTRPSEHRLAQVVSEWNDYHRWNPISLDAAQFLVNRLWPSYPPTVTYIRAAGSAPAVPAYQLDAIDDATPRRKKFGELAEQTRLTADSADVAPCDHVYVKNGIAPGFACMKCGAAEIAGSASTWRCACGDVQPVGIPCQCGATQTVDVKP